MRPERESMFKQLNKAADEIIERFNKCAAGSKERFHEAKSYATICELQQRLIAEEEAEDRSNMEFAHKVTYDTERNSIEKEKLKIERMKIEKQLEIEKEKIHIENMKLDNWIWLERLKIDKYVEIEKIKAAANNKDFKAWIYENSGLLLKGAIALACSMVVTAMVLTFENREFIIEK